MTIVTMIVDRCHVGESYRSVIRYVISRLRSGYETYRAMPRDDRRTLLRHIVDRHSVNRQLYRDVMYPTCKEVTDER